MWSVDTTSCTKSEGASLQFVGCAQQTSAHTREMSQPRNGMFWASGVFAALLFAGTGGNVSTASASTAAKDLGLARTGSACRVECISVSRRDEEEDRIAGSSEGLPATQHYLSLNLSDLAAVLRVSRPTIYAWLREESAPQSQNISRMRLLYGVAKMCAGISPKRMGGYLKRPGLDGRSVFDLLCEERIDKVVVREEFVSISRMIEGEETRTRPRTATEIAKQFGLRSQSKQSQEESIAQETGL